MTRIFTRLSLLILFVWLFLLGDRYGLSSDSHPAFAPVIRHSSGKTDNWAGYVAATELSKPAKHSVTDVRATWRVPGVFSSGALDTASAIWVGIDGDTDNTVEQIGTEQDWTSGAPVYYAWFEMYPSPGFRLTIFPVQPGDEISAEVQAIAKNKYQLSISNLTQNAGFSIIKKKSAKATSAEWIVEAPFLRRILPLADFGSVTFTGCSTTMEGIEGAIANASWQDEGLTMENSFTSTILAQPSALSAGGTSFLVDWNHH